MKPPVAKQVPYTHKAHGDHRADPYFWLQNKNNPEVIDYLKAENAYAQEKLKPVATLKEVIYQETISRIQETDQDVPWPYAEYEYYYRTEAGEQHDIFCRRLKGSEEEVILFNENEFAKDSEYFAVGTYSLSLNQQWLAITVDTSGDEEYELWLKDLGSGKLKKGLLNNIAASIVFSSNNHDLWYCRFDQAKRPYQVWCYDITGKQQDVMLFQEDDERFWLGVARSESDRYLFVSASSKLTSETHYIAAGEPRGQLKCFLKREFAHEYDIEDHEDYFYILSNKDAKNFKLMRCELEQTEPTHWQEVIPHDINICIEGFAVFKDYFVLSQRIDGLPQLCVFEPKNRKQHLIEFPDVTYSCGLEQNWEYDSEILRFAYNSMNTPPSIFAYNMKTHERTLLKQVPVLGEYDPQDYRSEYIMASAEDGTSVPISLVYKKSILNKPMPLVLVGYGSYGIDMDPWFSYSRISLLDRGMIYAIAHIRGGGEFGEPWYDDGKLMHKKNTFSDFIACAKHLIAENYTDSEQLFISGGSAGGLLMGAVVNAEPTLFRGVIAHVPFVDTLNTMLDETLPLTVTEYEEWGNPNELPAYNYIKSYSPYDNVQSLPYPSMFITCGLEDPRVSYWEAAKWTAKLRQHSIDDSPILLKINMAAGHQGQSGRYNAIEEVAEEYSFILGVLDENI
jgi:oligopeptidase B